MIKINYSGSDFVLSPFDPTEPYIVLTQEEYDNVKDSARALKKLILLKINEKEGK